LTIEKLCKELGVSGESVEDDIAFFVREDVDARVQKVLDAARIVESNAVPPSKRNARGRPKPLLLPADYIRLTAG
jgi:hypothetical protein